MTGTSTLSAAPAAALPAALDVGTGSQTVAQPQQAVRLQALDGVRGLAALGVVIYHLNPVAGFWLWSCVDLFFVLSGFLITGIVLKAQARGTWSLLNFWMRRAIRIWPVYFLTLGIALVGLALREIEDPGIWARTQDIAPSFVFLQHVGAYFTREFAVELNYIPDFRHGWSVAAEEQFYLLWPLLVLAFARWRPLAVALCLALVGLGILMRSNGFSYSLLLTRCDGIALGALLAFALHWSGAESAGSRWRIRQRGFALLALIVAMPLAAYFLLSGYGLMLTGHSLLATPAWYWPIAVTAFAASYALLVWALVSGVLPALSRWLSSRPLVWLGSVSYALYMFHVPLQNMVFSTLPGEGLILRVLRFSIYIALLLGLSHASRVLVENPADRLKHRFRL